MLDNQDPPTIQQLVTWCSRRQVGRFARNHRVPALLAYFADLLSSLCKPVITVTGTTGKGSTCTLLASTLTADGNLTGVFTSPHLRSFCERIRLGNTPISSGLLSQHVNRVFPRLQLFVEKYGSDFHPSMLESLTIIAASVFREQGVTASVFEAGIGGSNDVMSFLPATLSVVTSVDLDHQDELGTSLEEIATDKAGLAPTGGLLVVGPRMPTLALGAIQREAGRRGVQCLYAQSDFGEVVSSDIHGQHLQILADHTSRSVFLPLVGSHQILNLSTVWTCVQTLHSLGYVKSLDAIAGVRSAKIPGRFEIVQGKPSWLLDVAHNYISIEALASTVARFYLKDSVVALVGATEPHDYCRFLPVLFPMVSQVGFCGGFHRAVPSGQLASMLPKTVRNLGIFETPSQALDHILAEEQLHRKTVIVTGSLFLVAAYRLLLEQRRILKNDW